MSEPLLKYDGDEKSSSDEALFPLRKHARLAESRMFIKDDYLDSALDEISVGEMRIFSVNHNVKERRVFHPEMRYPPVQMQFLLRGDTVMKSNESGEVRKFTDNQHNIVYFPHGDVDYSMESPRVSVVGVQIPETAFSNLVDPDSKTLRAFFERMTAGKEAALVSARNLVMSPRMKSILYEIPNCKLNGNLKALFLEAKVIELFVAQIEQADSLDYAVKMKLSAADMERAGAVKEMLDRDPLGNFSLLGLAKAAGFNDYKLKKGFKEMFGTTVFSYLRHLRMEEAKRMMLDEKKSVSEVSWLVGYSEPHHFTTAFKREFGYLPRELSERIPSEEDS